MTATHRASQHAVTAELPRLTYLDPPMPRRRTRRIAPLVAVLVGLTAFTALATVVVQRRQARFAAIDTPAVLTVDDGHWRYVFHAPTGSEALYRTDVDPGCHTNLRGDEPARTETLRRTMLRQQGAESLDALREPHRDMVDSLRSLGYL